MVFLSWFAISLKHFEASDPLLLMRSLIVKPIYMTSYINNATLTTIKAFEMKPPTSAPTLPPLAVAVAPPTPSAACTKPSATCAPPGVPAA